MKKVYFVHRDKNAIERQSDGVEFVSSLSSMTEEFISIVMNMIYFGVQSRMLVTMPGAVISI